MNNQTHLVRITDSKRAYLGTKTGHERTKQFLVRAVFECFYICNQLLKFIIYKFMSFIHVLIVILLYIDV